MMSEDDYDEHARRRFEAWKRSFAERYNLTQREMEILSLITRRGYSNKEIAEHCCITEKTVKNHLTNVMAKMGARSMRRLLSLFINHICREA